MYRIKAIKWDDDFRFVIQKKKSFIFWISGSGECFKSATAAEKYLSEMITKKNNIIKEKYYLIKNDKIISGDSVGETKKKIKLLSFL